MKAGLVTLLREEKSAADNKRAADDLTIEENVLKKILQEKIKLCQTQEIVSRRKQLMLRDKKTLY